PMMDEWSTNAAAPRSLLSSAVSALGIARHRPLQVAHHSPVVVAVRRRGSPSAEYLGRGQLWAACRVTTLCEARDCQPQTTLPAFRGAPFDFAPPAGARVGSRDAVRCASNFAPLWCAPLTAAVDTFADAPGLLRLLDQVIE